MKTSTFFTSIITAAATLVSAAPAATSPVSKRAELDLNAFNQFSFENQDLEYFQAVNELDLNPLVQLSVDQGLDLGSLQAIFVQDSIDINALLQLQQIQLLSQLGGLGLLGGVDLAVVELNVLDLGILGDVVGGFDIASLIDQSLVPQIQTVIQQTELKTIVLK